MTKNKKSKDLTISHELDAFRYSLEAFHHLGLKEGDWVLYKDQLAIVQGITFKGITITYITGMDHVGWATTIDDYRNLKKVPKESSLESARILYGS